MNILQLTIRIVIASTLIVITFYFCQVFLKAIEVIVFRGHDFDITTIYVAIQRMHFRSLQFQIEVFIGALIFIFTIIILKKFNIYKFVHMIYLFFAVYLICNLARSLLLLNRSDIDWRNEICHAYVGNCIPVFLMYDVFSSAILSLFFAAIVKMISSVQRSIR